MSATQQFNSHLTLEQLETIFEKEPEAALILGRMIKHVFDTYGDKYQSDVTKFINTKELLYSKDGKAANLHCSLKYIQRYMTEGFEKSNNPVDLYKSFHYILFELTRRHKENGKDNVKTN